MDKSYFDNAPCRVGSDAVKYYRGKDVLPMWIADMDFPTAPSVEEAIKQRAAFPIFGYVNDNDAWKEAVVSFFSRNHGLSLKKENLLFSTGVLASLTATLLSLTSPKEEVIVCSPIYNCFFSCIEHTGRKVLDVPLLEKENDYRFDFVALEKAFKRSRLFILCNPHNPVGKVWEKDELAKLVALAKENGVVIFSDEIHGELTAPSHPYHSIFEVEGAKEVALLADSPTKAFNIAGIQTSFLYCENKLIREAVERQLGYDDCAEPNSFSLVAMEAAYKEGDEYLDALREYIASNRIAAIKEINSIPGLQVVGMDATYLLWVDCSSIEKDSKKLSCYLIEKSGLFVSDGAQYRGEGHIRINVACPRVTMEEGLKRLRKGIESYK